ncbi:hypothetical protein N7504_011308 [Penicillium tannophilum]|nr:hypothetical protein N7504_011308 [Penicillium tannophilum]
MPPRAWIIFPLVFTLAYIWFNSTMSFPASSPYNEEKIITQINTVYNLLLKLSYFTPDRINFPPEDGHIINKELCRSLHLTPAVVSLMKRIPYVIDGYHKPIIWQSRAYEYTRDEEIRNGRDPERTDAVFDEDELRMDFLRPWELALTCWLDDGISVILDTKSNVIRVIDESEPVDDFREDSEAHDALAYLQKIIDDIRNLEVVYFPGRDFESIYLSGSYEQAEVKRILINEFGWGTEEFREDDWRREGLEICERIESVGIDEWEERQRNAPAPTYI